MKPSPRAAKLNRQALEHKEKGDLANAVALFRQATAIAPGWSTPWYNLGLIFKYDRRWQESFDCNRRAAETDPSSQEAWWNLGIAATALERWSDARWAWRGYGIDVPDGDDPVELACGFGPVRINPRDKPEVVWADRLDPARAQIASIPFPESGHRWGDIVLNDGAPMGFRRYQGKDIPVFDELQLLKSSAFGTFVARAHVPAEDGYATKLAEIAEQMGGCGENWTTSTRILCKACSEGRPHATHDTHATPPTGVHIIALAGRDREHAESILKAWDATSAEIHIESLDVGLEPA